MHLPADAVIGILADGSDLGDALRYAFQQRGILSKFIHTDQKQAVGPLAGLLIVSPEQVCTDMLKRAFTVIRKYGPQLQQVATHSHALLASVSRLNGKFGLGPDAIAQPLSAGLCKTSRHAPYMSLPVGAGNLDMGLHRLVLKTS